MNFKEFYLQEDLLNEMIIIGDVADQNYVIAFDKWIWTMNDESENKIEMIKDIASKLDIRSDYEDIYEFISYIQEQKSDVLVGQIQDKNLYLYDYGSFKLDLKSSILIKKVVKELKLKSASYMEDIDSTETKVTKKKMIGQTPNVAYHGTSSKYLESILSTGLRSSQADSNYAKQGIYHDDLIFFSTRIGEAMHHAQHTADLKGGIPVILEFEIPDKALMIADYDVEKLTSTDSYYANTGERSKYGGAYKQSPDQLSKEFGVYGYKGSIKPVFIKYVYVSIKRTEQTYNIKDDFRKMKPKASLKYIEYNF